MCSKTIQNVLTHLRQQTCFVQGFLADKSRILSNGVEGKRVEVFQLQN